MGAKNHGVIMPDANKEYTINQVGDCFSQNISDGWRRLRCRGPAVHGPVDGGAGGGGQVLAARGGNHPHWIEVRVLRQLAKRATKLRITAGHEADADLGPVISPQAKVGLSNSGFLKTDSSGTDLLSDPVRGGRGS